MSEATRIEAKRSSLFERHQTSGATFAEWYGWEMPALYSDAGEEQRAVRTAVGVIDLSYNGAIRVGGSEGRQFLNGLVTNDVKTMTAGHGVRAAFLTGHGKVRALCRILGLESDFLILNDPQTHEAVYKYVFPFSYAGDFKVEDASQSCRILSVQGPKALLVMKEVCFEPIPNLGELDWAHTKVAGHDVIVAKSSRTGELGFDIIAHESQLGDIWDFLILKGAFHDIIPVGQQALDALRIEAGELVYGIDVDESNMMLETGLSNAVSFTKGCYTGQEAVAMATYRGHVSKKICGLKIDGEALPERGDELFKEGKPVGRITSPLKSITLNCVVALGYVKHGYSDSGAMLEVQTRGKGLSATIVDLPFYRPVVTTPQT